MSETSNRGPRHGRPHAHSRRRYTPNDPSAEGIDQQRLAELDREEPLSIAEELDKCGFTPGGPFPPEARGLLKSSLSAANSSIRAVAGSRPECHGMGATVVVCITSSQVLISHLGDSRGYLFADNRLTQLTEDHTLAQQYLKSGMINEKEALSWPGRNLLIKGLGIEADVDPDICVNELNQDTIYLLCSDGLTDAVSDRAIAQCLRTATDNLELTARQLIDKAIDNGGPDNISVILIRAADSGHGQ